MASAEHDQRTEVIALACGQVGGLVLIAVCAIGINSSWRGQAVVAMFCVLELTLFGFWIRRRRPGPGIRS